MKERQLGIIQYFINEYNKDAEKANFTRETADLIQRLIDESANFLQISRHLNPTTGHILERVDKCPLVIVMVTNPTMDKGIFVKQYRVGCEDFIWECPASVIEPNQSPTDAVYAELRQEIGLEQESIQQLITVGKEVYTSVGWTNEIKHFFIAVVDEDVELKEQQLDENENLTYAWHTFEEIENEPINKVMPLSTRYLIGYVRNLKNSKSIDVEVKGFINRKSPTVNSGDFSRFRN